MILILIHDNRRFTEITIHSQFGNYIKLLHIFYIMQKINKKQLAMLLKKNIILLKATRGLISD